MSSPTQRSLKLLRDRGYNADVTERWHGGKLHDLWGFIDIAGVNDEEFVFVQTTTASNVSARWHKIQALPVVRRVLSAGGQIEIHGWAKRGPRGVRKTWCARIIDVLLREGQLVKQEAPAFQGGRK